MYTLTEEDRLTWQQLALDCQGIQKYAAQLAPLGDWAEFGTAKGGSASVMLPYLPPTSRFYLFDSFKGLSEDWAVGDKVHFRKGAFRTKPPVFDDDRVVIVKGWFENTLPRWCKKRKKPLSFVHIDCDLYSSTMCVLENICPFLVNGSLILFDEFKGRVFHEEHEQRAFNVFFERAGIEPPMRVAEGVFAQVLFRWQNFKTFI